VYDVWQINIAEVEKQREALSKKIVKFWVFVKSEQPGD